MTFQTIRKTATVSVVLLSALVVRTTSATELGDIQGRERGATNFRDLTPNQPAPAGTLPLASFKEPGTVVFIQNLDFYLRDSNRAWGLFGRGKATIEFSRPMRSVSLSGRGSSDQDKMGPLFRHAPLAQAKGVVRALDVNRKVIATRQLSNTSVRAADASLISFKSVRGIAAIEIENTAVTTNSLVVIAGIGITPLNRADLTGDGLVDVADLVAVVMALDCMGPACVHDNRRNPPGPQDLAAVIADLGTN